MGKKVLYIGSFPPPYGGVTIKNELVFSFLKENGIEMISFHKKGRIKSFFYYFFKSFACHQFVFGMSTKTFSKLFLLLGILHPIKIKRSVIIAMGGIFPDLIRKKRMLKKLLSKSRGILVETTLMKTKMEYMGFNNCDVFPNCRNRPSLPLVPSSNDGLRCLYFSRISKDKGASFVLEAASVLPDVDFDFYGAIDSLFAAGFNKTISSLKNCNYLGECVAKGMDLYLILNKYDVLLFPSMWNGEGVSGALVEAKIAGLPAIVTDWNYNPVVVGDNIDGIVMKTNDFSGIVGAICRLKDDRLFLTRLKENAYKNGQKYYIDSYRDLFIKMIG